MQIVSDNFNRVRRLAALLKRTEIVIGSKVR